jgi:hypothetical protein
MCRRSTPASAQFVPQLEWATLEQVNEREGTSLPDHDLNTTDSQLRLIGAFYSNYPQSYGAGVDATRGLLYLPETPYGPWISARTGGAVAVVDLRTASLQRRLYIEHEGQPVTPSEVSLDTVANRLFVTDFYARRLYIADAMSGG